MSRHSITWVILFGVIALMFLKLPQMVAKQDAVVTTYSALVEVDALAKQNYVEAIKGTRLVDGAIRGMMRQLDPYSGYITPAELPAFERRNHGEYIGIGIEAGIRLGRLTVIAPIEGGPAATAGVMAGDVIVSIDGKDIDGLSVFDVEEQLRGAAGSAVRVRVLHAGVTEPVTLTISRGRVSLHTVRGCRRSPSGAWDYLIDAEHRIGYLRVSSFLDNTMQEFAAALDHLVAQGTRGLVLDLRFNPGGAMHQAIAMVDRFVNTGVILETVTRRRAVREYLATTHDTLPNIKLAVLVNGGSASAAEIVSGSLQALGRAKVVGSRSFGKGSVQHLIHLREKKGAIKLTIAYYRLPDGRIVHRTAKNATTDAWGVIPDIAVDVTLDEVAEILRSRAEMEATTTTVDSNAIKHANLVSAPSTLRQQEMFFDRQLDAAIRHLVRELGDEETQDHPSR